METPILRRLVKKAPETETAPPPPPDVDVKMGDAAQLTEEQKAQRIAPPVEITAPPTPDPLPPEDSRFLRTPALAKVLGVRTMAVRDWVRRGLIPTVEGAALRPKEWPHFEVEKVRATLNTNEEARVELGIELNRMRRARERAQKRAKKNAAAPATSTAD